MEKVSLSGIEIAQAIDKLRSPECLNRVSVFELLPQIIDSFTPDELCTCFIPFLLECVDDIDEIILIITDSIVQLTNIFTEQSQLLCILPLIDALIRHEELDVRQKVANSTSPYLEKLNQENIINNFFPVVKSLFNSPCPISKSGGLQILPSFLKKLPNSYHQEVIQLINSVSAPSSSSSASSPLVRKALANNLALIYMNIDPNLSSNLLTIFKNLVKDSQELVRVEVIYIIPLLSKLVPFEVKKLTLAPIVIKLSRSKSWRIRYTVCKHMKDILPHLISIVSDVSVGPNGEKFVTLDDLIMMYLSWLQDDEQEVKDIASSQLQLISNSLPLNEVLQKILPVVTNLIYNETNYVRITLASEICKICKVIGKKNTEQLIFPIFSSLLLLDNHEVILSIVKQIYHIEESFSKEFILNSFLPALQTLTKSNKWRNRLEIIESLLSLSSILEMEFFNQNLLLILLNFLLDPINEIRLKSVEIIVQISKTYGENWILNSVLPKLQDQLNIVNKCTFKLILLNLYESLLSEQIQSKNKSNSLISTLITSVLFFYNDIVANVRIYCAKIFLKKDIILILDSKIIKEVTRILKKLSQDPDIDVKNFANNALITFS